MKPLWKLKGWILTLIFYPFIQFTEEDGKPHIHVIPPLEKEEHET